MNYELRGPSIYDVHTKIGFLTPPLCPHASTPHEPDPLLDVHMASEKMTPFLGNFLDFGYLAGKLSIISAAKISFFSLFTKIQILHVNRVNCLILCVDV